MAQNFLKIFGRKDFHLKIFGISNSQKEIKNKLGEILIKIENCKNRTYATMCFNSLISYFEKKKNQKEKSERGKLSTYSFISSIDEKCRNLEFSDSKKFEQEAKKIFKQEQKKLSYWAAINTRDSLKLIENIIEEISEKPIEIEVTFYRFCENDNGIRAKFSSNDKINEELILEKLRLKDVKCLSGFIISDKRDLKDAEKDFIAKYIDGKFQICKLETFFQKSFSKVCRLHEQYTIKFLYEGNWKELKLYSTQSLSDARKELNLSKNYFLKNNSNDSEVSSEKRQIFHYLQEGESSEITFKIEKNEQE